MTTTHTDPRDIAVPDAVARTWPHLIATDGWDDVEPDGLFERAVEAVAWGLIDATMDTSDREPSVETYHEAAATARRLLHTLDTSPAPCGHTGDDHDDQCRVRPQHHHE